jgi:hypothetical protein
VAADDLHAARLRPEAHDQADRDQPDVSQLYDPTLEDQVRTRQKPKEPRYIPLAERCAA